MDEKPESTPSREPVAVGMRVEVELVSQNGETDRLELIIVADKQADFSAGYLGAGTPLAQAILGQTVGSEVTYRVADMRAVRILAAAPSGELPDEEAIALREEKAREAANKVALINAMMIATSVNNKWGD